jgi:hypothetical protein
MGNTITKNNKLAGWIDDFVNAFAGKESIEKTAEININDLPKVVWNDETFFVFFDIEGASIINSFKNTVTTLPNVKTMEEVNKELNGKQIVSEFDGESIEINAEIENEINKALANTILADANDDAKAQEYINNDPNSNSNEQRQENQVPAVSNPAVPEIPGVPVIPQPGDTTEAQIQTKILNDVLALIKEQSLDLKPIEGLTATLIQSDNMEKNAELIDAKFAAFESKISEMLDNKISSIVEQLYARTNPGNVYDLGNDIQQQEINKFTQEAAETENKITTENNIDRTTPEGKYKVDNIVVEIELNNVSENESNELDNVEDIEIELPEEEQEMFKEGNCPFCMSRLAKTDIKNNFVNIECSGCDVKYKINTDTERIYIK